MRILVIGSGGREHALAWKIAQSVLVEKVFVAPGNAGTAAEAKVENIALTLHSDLIRFCHDNQIDFTVVGPETALAAGITDVFQEAGLLIFGPTRAAARLESSKDYAKRFMYKYHIPTAAFQTFTDCNKALVYVAAKKMPIVIKADGLAAGKGVVIANTQSEARLSLNKMLADGQGGSVVIEDFLEGEEASFMVMVADGHILPLATSQDHKRLADFDEGPNTGGMGAYSPAPVVTAAVFEKTMERIIKPAVAGLAAEGHPFTGFLYAGLMIAADGNPYTVEFNCRLGDPETQAIMLRLETDFAVLLQSALSGKLADITLNWHPDAAVGVVLAAAGYPAAPKLGEVINGLAVTGKDIKIFHAGTKTNRQGQIVTNGGRVLCVAGRGKDIAAARAKAYTAVTKINFKGMQYRRDIAARALSEG